MLKLQKKTVMGARCREDIEQAIKEEGFPKVEICWNKRTPKYDNTTLTAFTIDTIDPKLYYVVSIFKDKAYLKKCKRTKAQIERYEKVRNLI